MIILKSKLIILKGKNMKNIKTCIVLCGGMSRRMGVDKGSMIFEGKPMIIHTLNTLNNEVDEVFIVLNDRDRISYYSSFINNESFNFKLYFLEDEVKDKGPISGILTGLNNINSEYSLVLPCDSPFVSKKFLRNIFQNLSKSVKENFNAIVPYGFCEEISKKDLNQFKIEDSKKEFINSSIEYKKDPKENLNEEITDPFKINYSEPLHSIYQKNNNAIIKELLDKDIRDIKSLFKKIDVFFIKKEDLVNDDQCFKNFNKPDDL